MPNICFDLLMSICVCVVFEFLRKHIVGIRKLSAIFASFRHICADFNFHSRVTI